MTPFTSRPRVRPFLWMAPAAALLVVAALAMAQTEEGIATPASIRAVRYNVEPGRTRVWLETTRPVLYTHYSPDPLTLVIDLPGVEISQIPDRTVVGSREVESIVATKLSGGNGLQGRTSSESVVGAPPPTAGGLKALSRVEIKLVSMVPYQLSASEQALTVVFESAGTLPPAGISSDAPTPPTKVDSSAITSTPLPLDNPPSAVAVSPGATHESISIPKPGGPPARAKAPSSAVAKSVPATPATLIRSVTHDVTDDLLSVTVGADGRLSYTSFRLENPDRLVFDFTGVTNRVPRAQVSLASSGVSQARIAQYRASNPSITRVVFDLTSYNVHRAVEDGKNPKIYFATSPDRLAKAVPLAAMEPQTPQLEQAPPPALPRPSEISAQGATIQRVAVVAQQPLLLAVPEPAQASPPLPLGEGRGEGPPELVASAPPDAAGALKALPMLPSPAPAAAVEPPPVSPGQGGGMPQPGGQPPSPGGFEGRTLGPEQKVYTGELISLDFKDGDIQDIFRLFAEISGLNIVVQPGVSGRVTLRLNEVPWDQALELVLKTNKLGYIEDGNVIRIAPLSQLAEEEAERRKLAEEKALAGELSTLTRQLSYAKAKDVEPLLKRNLSPRGDIVIDTRTNTLIITDLPGYLTNVQDLLGTLDTPIPGVEIEARIVVTTKTFARQLGVQWGFSARMDPYFGNTTELTFPNSIQIGGQAIGSQVTDEFSFPQGPGGILPPQVGPGQTQRGYAVNLPTPASPTGAIGVSLGSITGAFSIDAAIAAAETLGTVRILSAPKIITQNNTPASIKQGVSFPVQTVANNTVTVQFRDAVLELVVTPQITSAETIILDLVVNNNSLDFGRAVNGIPSIITQSATTQVLVSDGSTTVIGGVFVNTDSRNDRYVPLLHKIPILGYLFKSNDISSANQELLIFITPRIRKGQA